MDILIIFQIKRINLFWRKYIKKLIYCVYINNRKFQEKIKYAWEYTYNKPYIYQKIFKISEKVADKKHL